MNQNYFLGGDACLPPIGIIGIIGIKTTFWAGMHAPEDAEGVVLCCDWASFFSAAPQACLACFSCSSTLYHAASCPSGPASHGGASRPSRCSMPSPFSSPSATSCVRKMRNSNVAMCSKQCCGYFRLF